MRRRSMAMGVPPRLSTASARPAARCHRMACGVWDPVPCERPAGVGRPRSGEDARAWIGASSSRCRVHGVHDGAAVFPRPAGAEKPAVHTMRRSSPWSSRAARAGSAKPPPPGQTHAPPESGVAAIATSAAPCGHGAARLAPAAGESLVTRQPGPAPPHCDIVGRRLASASLSSFKLPRARRSI